MPAFAANKARSSTQATLVEGTEDPAL